MKKILPIVMLSMLVFASFSGSILAQTTTDAAKIKARVAERKARQKTKLDTATEKRVKQRCAKAQDKVETLLVRVKEKSAARDQKYTDFVTRADKVIAKLQARGNNVAELNQALLNAKSQQEAIAKSYSQQLAALEDLSKMDCVSDPAGFKAALTDARNHSAGLKKARGEQVKNVKETLKPSLKAARESLNE